MNNNITVAIDGNAASGKGTLAKNLATYFNYAHLDTGKLYRASALVIKENGIDFTSVPHSEFPDLGILGDASSEFAFGRNFRPIRPFRPIHPFRPILDCQ